LLALIECMQTNDDVGDVDSSSNNNNNGNSSNNNSNIKTIIINNNSNYSCVVFWSKDVLLKRY